MRRLGLVGAAMLMVAGTSPSVAQTTRPAPAPGVHAQLAARDWKAPDGMKVRFAMGLLRPESQAVSALRSVSDPASASYRRFPSRGEIKSRFGIQDKVLDRVRPNVRAAGLKMTLNRTGVFVTVKGTVGRMSRWLGAPIRLQQATRSGLRLKLLTSNGRPPRAIRKYVDEFVAMDVKAAATSSAARLTYSGRNTGTPVSCLPEQDPEISKYTYSYNQLRTAYGLDALPAGEALGRQTRVTVLGQGEGFSRAALKASAACFNRPNMSVDRVAVPGLSTALKPGYEGNLDLQVVQAVLPAGSRVTVVEASAYDLRDYLTYATAYSHKQLPHVVTTSYGYCERDLSQLPRDTIELTESVLARVSLAGTSVFAASGDRGSSDCINNATGRGPKGLAVDYPASSPHVTGVGGTRISLDAQNRRTDEVVWNSAGLDPPLGPIKLAGGGGTSREFKRPWWQDAVVQQKKRAVPDLSGHAAPGPAWPIFTGGSANSATFVGGTSATAPFVAATVGVLAAHQGRPFGLLQPTLYAMPGSAFHDITSGSNDLYRRGCCKATVGYDRATGLGAPRFERWLQDLPPAR